MAPHRRESSAETAARFLASRRKRKPKYRRPARRDLGAAHPPRTLVAKPEALAARRVTGHLQGRLSARTASSIVEVLGQPLAGMLGFAEPHPTARVVVDFCRATFEEIHRRLCDCLVDGTDTHITRVAEDMVRSALEYRERR